MGSIFRPKIEAAPPPQQAEFVNQIDEINRIKTEKVKQADGSEAIVTTRLPLTPEEQAYEDELKAIEAESLDWINKLTNDPTASSLPWVKDYIDNYKATAMAGIDEGMAARTKQEERMLARSGMEDSTAAANARSARGADYSGQIAQLGRDAVGIQQDARTQALNNYGSLYSLASGKTSGIISQLQNAIGQQSSAGLQGQQIKQGYFNSVANTAANNSALQTQAAQGGFANMASLAQLALYAGGQKGFGFWGRK